MSTFTQAPPGFRLPDGLTLGPVRLEVSNLNRSVAYYQEVLGLRATQGVGRAILVAQHDSVPLVELHERPGATPVPRRGRLGLYHFALLLPERADLGRFLSHLSSMRLHPGMSDHLVSEALYLSDPDGLGIEVYADRPRDMWTVWDGSIAMATDPLNVDDLIGSAGATSWTGAPRGTRVGHVHLHVGDLTQAEKFYHAGLGLDRVVLGFPGALFLSAGGYHHHLGTNTWAAGAPSAKEGDARLLEWTVTLPEAEQVSAAANSLRAGGYQVFREGKDAVSADPWGTT
ncbi:MAG TPA: VOC family protein, partial [Gemmatimonadales bacterium]|nr:VOC family protein [Gemmatimonadales bacterium]